MNDEWLNKYSDMVKGSTYFGKPINEESTKKELLAIIGHLLEKDKLNKERYESEFNFMNDLMGVYKGRRS